MNPGQESVPRKETQCGEVRFIPRPRKNPEGNNKLKQLIHIVYNQQLQQRMRIRRGKSKEDLESLTH
jgi:hypothetical protein